MLNYQSLFLSDRDLHILNSSSSGAILTLHESDAEFLLSIKFIAPYQFSSTGKEYIVTPEGLRFKEFLNKQKEHMEEENRREFIKTWVPIAISNLIAFIALVISILK